MISKTDGSYLKEQLRDERISGGVELNIQFLMSDRTTFWSDHVNIDVWYTASDHRSVRMVEHLANYVDSATNYFDINPKIVTFDCNTFGSKNCDIGYKRLHCLGNGKYCDMHSEKDDKYGTWYLLETLFQYCIVKESSFTR